MLLNDLGKFYSESVNMFKPTSYSPFHIGYCSSWNHNDKCMQLKAFTCFLKDNINEINERSYPKYEAI